MSGYEFYGLILGLFLFVILVVRGGQWWLVVMGVGSNSGVGFAVDLRENRYTEKERRRDRLRIKKN